MKVNIDLLAIYITRNCNLRFKVSKKRLVIKFIISLQYEPDSKKGNRVKFYFRYIVTIQAKMVLSNKLNRGCIFIFLN